MNLRTPLAALAAATLALAACGDGDDAADDTADDTTDDTTTVADDPAATDESPGEDAPDVDAPPAGGDDVPDGVAASVGPTEITVDTVEGLYEEISTSPVFAAQLEDDETGAVATTLRAQLLSQLVVQEIVERGAADDFGIEVTDADLDASLARVEAETEAQGGLDAALEMSGLTREAFVRLELPLMALLDQLEAEFGDLQPDPGADPGEMPAGQAELQEWGVDKFAAADVAVSPDYGTWDPVAGQVLPVGG